MAAISASIADSLYYTQECQILILQSLEESLLRVSQAYEFRDALIQNNVDHTIFTYQGGHGTTPEHPVGTFGYIAGFLQ